MPRPYIRGQRAVPRADTRARIIEAALGVYRQRGLAGASNLAWLGPPTWLRRPSATISRSLTAWRARCSQRCWRRWMGIVGLRARVERLARELAAFYQRSQPVWGMYEREPELIRVWGGGVERYDADIERLMRVALGDLGDDERSVAVVASVVGPPTFFALEARGPTFDETVTLTLDLALPWLEHRRGDRAART